MSTEDFTRFLAWWPGEYDNLAQVEAQARAKLPAKERNASIRLFIAPVDLPAFGDHVCYAEWQAIDDPLKVLRQRFYALTAEGGKFRLGLHVFPLDRPAFVARTAGGYRDPGKLAGVTPADMMDIKGGDVFFAADGEAFTGAMVRGSCRYNAPPDGRPVSSWTQMKLTRDTFSYLDAWYSPDGATLYKKFSGDWYVFNKKT
jgi:hypothetical protein